VVFLVACYRLYRFNFISMVKRVYILALVVSIFSLNLLLGQDDLEKRSKEKTLKELYKEFPKLRASDTLEMRLTIERLFEKAKQTNNPEYYIMGYHRLGNYHIINEQYAEAAAVTDTAVNYLNDAPEFYNKVQIFFVNGSLNRTLGRYEKSLENFLRALEVAKKDKNEIFELTSRIAIAKIKGQVYNPKEAIDICLESLEFIEKTQNSLIKSYYNEFLIDLWTTLSNKYLSIDDYENALYYCNKLLEKGRQSGNKDVITRGVIGLSDIYSLTGEYDKALSTLKEFDNLGDIANKTFYQVLAYLFYARIYFYIKEYDKALTALEKIDDLQEKRSFDFFVLQEKYVLYAKTYQSLVNTELSLKYFNEAKNVYKNNTERKSRLSLNITERYNLVEYKNEIDTLLKKSEAQKFWVKVVSVIFVLILGVSIIYMLRLRLKNKKKFEALMTQLDKNKHKKQLVFSKSEDPKVMEILIRLNEYEKKEFFLDTSMTLNQLAKKINTNTTYLSRVINQEKKCSFSKYITNLRIDYSLYKLKTDEKFRSYSISGIASEVGFNNIPPFIKDPSYFIKQLNKKNNDI